MVKAGVGRRGCSQGRGGEGGVVKAGVGGGGGIKAVVGRVAWSRQGAEFK